MDQLTPAAGALVTLLAGGTLAVFTFTMLWDFIRGLARG